MSIDVGQLSAWWGLPFAGMLLSIACLALAGAGLAVVWRLGRRPREVSA